MSKSIFEVGQNHPFAAARAVADASVHAYGPAHLERGGPAGRAWALLAKGASVPSAAAGGARQGKGHVAEIRVSAEHTLASGLRGRAHHSRPNPVANDPQIDVEVLRTRRVNGAQVGVGSPSYLRRKVMRSQAPQVVLNFEARDLLREEPAFFLSDDRLRHRDTASRALSGELAEEEATVILERMLVGATSVPEWMKLSFAASSGMRASIVSFSRALLFGAVHRLGKGLPLDMTLVQQAAGSGVDGFFKGGLQAYLAVNHFLGQAGDSFDSRLLHRVAKATVIAGAIAEVVVDTARDLARYVKGEISIQEVCRRAVVVTAGAAGGVVGYKIGRELSKGMSSGGAVAVTALATLLGSVLSTSLADWLTTRR